MGNNVDVCKWALANNVYACKWAFGKQASARPQGDWSVAAALSGSHASKTSPNTA